MKSFEAIFGPNSALVEELYEQYKANPKSVPPHWEKYFNELDGVTPAVPETQAIKPTQVAAPAPVSTQNGASIVTTVKAIKEAPKDAVLERIKGVAAKIVENMDDSLTIPTATSLRVIPVKMMIEDRVLINQHLEKRNEQKASFTHFIAWAVIKALEEIPAMNNSYYTDGNNSYKAIPNQVNLGIAIDLPNKDGSRNLVVPNIKGVDKMNFRQFLTAYSDLIDKARSGNLQLEDYQGTTISITNPGTIGTISSVPRLMSTQGTIIATGSIDYPAEFQAMAQEALNQLGISKVMTVTSTYDHRVIQGAESGMFLKRVSDLLTGRDHFYDNIFADLEIAYEPIPYGDDNYNMLFSGSSKTLEQDRRAVAVAGLINMYRTRGHVLADLNPLWKNRVDTPELDLGYYGLSQWDLDREFYCAGLGGKDVATLRQILKLLRDTYCGDIGPEYTHILDMEERKWLQETMESTSNKPVLTKQDKKNILHQLNQALAFEEFLQKKYIGHKRFSLEGAGTTIPMLHALLESAGADGIKKVLFGMAHRGRLNILVNVLNKPYHRVFAEFDDTINPESIQGSGDVKYHLGAKGLHTTTKGDEIYLEMLPNPSHLEAVNPVVEGAVRALQDHYEGEDAEKKILPVLIHGDAAFAGQGIVAETLNMSLLKGYKTGGTVHIIINNQIGFTTLPEDGRSTENASDLAKMILAPIFHVNGDRPEAAVHAIKLAFEYRQKFGKDVVVELICYRKHGHNEGDEPAFTQPDMYKEISGHPSVRDIYTQKLVKQNELTEKETQQIFDDFHQLLEAAFEDAKKAPNLDVTANMLVKTETKQANLPPNVSTQYPLKDLKEIGVKINTLPKDFDANPKLLALLAKRATILDENDLRVDWAFAEALAFGTLLKSGITIRMAGQDVERGTFSHRHAVLHGTETKQTFIPLNFISENQGRFYIYNSLLSEYAALGFEFGYSAQKDDALVIWEAQFGDFANGSQIIIDQFLSSSEAKWGQTTSLVLNLPHAYEGQGPEHSSARLERYLQLCAEDNMRVMNLTTPANYYHMLRRQALQEQKKPAVLMSPKSLLRHPLATSTANELAEGRFMPLIGDNEVTGNNTTKRLIICSGKVYYDLYKHRKDNNIQDVAIVRLEQFYPFPDRDISEQFESFSNVSDIVWCQEEPKNMGAWNFVAPRVQECLKSNQKLRYIGRPASASTATGQKRIHEAEQHKLIEEAMIIE